MRKPLSSHENRIEEQEPVKSLTSPNKRRYQQEPDDDSISSSTKRRRVPDDPSSPKNCYDELSDYAPNVSARTRTEHLKQLYAILNDELPYRSTSRSQIDSLDEAVGFIRYLKKKVGAGIEEASEL
ncbi:hypothetical protein O0I10_011974 [Lichtheimia ornata]|uniref:BHLH domain-containing protein n=1 Tax=Lichtheimia ornata TaxID=688661 RepID=A0AAD7UTE0_9FUNG|nr:uncharacterized protein O0I10_011974 [Lichtheimia ornata]KAJ8652394.1 hypothetical protein O0I10_011974 [Lichtheimia ornata]